MSTSKTTRHELAQLQPLPLNRRERDRERERQRQSVVERPDDDITSSVVRRDKRRVGEVAGGATADCAAIWCCCPCMTVNLLVLAVYKVPTAICRKAWRKQRRRMLKKKNVLPQPQPQPAEKQDIGGRAISVVDDEPEMDNLESSMRCQTAGEESMEEIEFEKQMWGQFKGTGFFRSYSQRDT